MAIPQMSEKERLILELLIGGDELYGLELVRAARGRLKQGTVYVTLVRMVEKGFVDYKVEEKEDFVAGRPRKFFKIRRKGEDVLRAWQKADFSYSSRRGG